MAQAYQQFRRSPRCEPSRYNPDMNYADEIETPLAPTVKSGIVVLFLGLILSLPAAAREPLQLVESLDLERYQGRWFEIARLPNRFQDQCAGDVTADYEILEHGRVRVTNRCRSADGGWREVEGIARRDTADGRDAALEVRFAPRWLSLLPFVWGEYRVMALDDDYQYALVGSDNRKYLWVLARRPDLSQSFLERLINEARRQGFDVSELTHTEHVDD